MLESIKQRLGRDDEQGFTLIELMVVVLIIAILLAIAIPTFLGARNSANARAAQSNLRNADTAEQTYWTNNQSWDTAPSTSTAGSVAQLETALTWQTTAPAAGTNQISVASDSTNNGIVLGAFGKDNNCYYLEVVDQPTVAAVTAGTYYQVTKPTSSACPVPSSGFPTAAAASGNASKNIGASVAATSWYTSW